VFVNQLLPVVRLLRGLDACSERQIGAVFPAIVHNGVASTVSVQVQNAVGGDVWLDVIQREKLLFLPVIHSVWFKQQHESLGVDHFTPSRAFIALVRAIAIWKSVSDEHAPRRTHSSLDTSMRRRFNPSVQNATFFSDPKDNLSRFES
jgi:hypothetical protein